MDILFIIGGYSTALEIREVAENDYSFGEIYNVVSNTDRNDNNEKSISDDDLKNYKYDVYNDYNYIISIADNKLRTKFINQLSEIKWIEPINIISSRAYISKSVNFGTGNYIAANSVLSNNSKIGNHNIINFSVTIGHDVIIGDQNVINPGVRISGNVKIENRTLIGSNSFIFQGKKIGSDTRIDALTYIDRDILDNKICSSKSLKMFDRVI